ncbi:MAG TPA: transglycosylase SLT domain-containing protein [Noviherbaspirillum sp.]|nr:transglycosylase SLT domain-containing protein [Noviherbaspirillum sp.]
MSNRWMRSMVEISRREAGRSAAIALVVRDTASGFFTTARHALMMIGFVALCATAALVARPEFGDRALMMLGFAEEAAAEETLSQPPLVAALLPAAPAAAHAVEAATHDAAEELRRQQERVANWIARRYRVASDATHLFVTTAYQTARELKLDPLLILSVMAIESRFNPFAESPAGAQGLMQVMSHIHKDKFEPLGGIEAALNPVANIQVGSRILKEYVTRGGSVEAGLKMYVGAAAFDTDFGYGAKVLAEHARLKDVAMGRKVPIHTRAASAPKPAAAPSAPETAQASAESGQPLAQAEQVASAL